MRHLYIGLLGLIGIFLRYQMGVWATRNLPPELPYSTFIVNMIGCLLIGAMYVIAFEFNSISDDLRTGFMVGLFGGFTTFSSYSLETVRLFETQKPGLALLYFLLSPSVCVGATYIGLSITRIFMRILY